MQKYSIIIPTFNEEKIIGSCLSSILQFDNNIEIIVVDGGSFDSTRNIVSSYPVKLFATERSRGIQLNKGASSASGDILIFLHADSILPPNAFEIISEYFTDPDCNCAVFKTKFDIDNSILKIYSWFSKFETMFTSFGDQTIIVRKDFFNSIGKFAEIPILEDVEFLRRVRKTGGIRKLPEYSITSARKFTQNGMIKNQLMNATYICRYLMFGDAHKIHSEYYS